MKNIKKTRTQLKINSIQNIYNAVLTLMKYQPIRSKKNVSVDKHASQCTKKVVSFWLIGTLTYQKKNNEARTINLLKIT